MSQNQKSDFARALAATMPPEEFLKLKAEQLDDPEFQAEVLNKFKDADGELSIQDTQVFNTARKATGAKVKRRGEPQQVLLTSTTPPTAIDILVGSSLWLNAAFYVTANPYGERTMRVSRAEAAALCSVAFNELYGMRLYAAPTGGYKLMYEQGFIVLTHDEDGQPDYSLTVAGAGAWQQLTLHYLDFILHELDTLMQMIQRTSYGNH